VSEPSPPQWHSLLSAVSSGELSVEDALQQIGAIRETGLHLDHDRVTRCGIPEVVFGGGKTADQIEAALRGISARADRALATRVDRQVGQAIADRISGAVWHRTARCITISPNESPTIGRVGILCAGTSDLPVAEEARITTENLGSRTEVFADVGVAGLHRLLGIRERLQEMRVLIVAAGMEGALPSVVGGLVRAPVIAVPTSVGYGANFGGVTALLAMLNSCAPGISVVNIDNGFGAGVIADRINRIGQSSDLDHQPEKEGLA